jgi:hypothetical protein
MSESTFSVREQIIEVCNRLFVYTDTRNWTGLINEVLADEVQFDMTSLGGAAGPLNPQQICDAWNQGFIGIDAIHHQAGTYLVDVSETGQSTAAVHCYATASHYKAAATQGHTREFVGTYDLHLHESAQGWRIDAFTYHLKYQTGNRELV